MLQVEEPKVDCMRSIVPTFKMCFWFYHTAYIFLPYTFYLAIYILSYHVCSMIELKPHYVMLTQLILYSQLSFFYPLHRAIDKFDIYGLGKHSI
jgi:hypothetical protein